MMEVELMAGGRCLGKPWRIGVAGITRDHPGRPFALGDAFWQTLICQLPWKQLKAYADVNGLIFEPVLQANDLCHDALLLVLSEDTGQFLDGLNSQVRRYLLLRGGQARLAPEHEFSFSRIFLPLGEPFTDGQLVSLNQPLNLPASPVVLHEWTLCDEEPELPGLLPQQWCECLAAGRVPVHLGNWSVPEWVPRGSFIEVRDLGDQSLIRAHCNANVKSAAKALHEFVANKSSYPYSSDCWITALTAAVAGDAAKVRDNRPLLSVIIPAYNYGRFLEKTISSVLEQDYDNVEILVLDNASTDNTYEVVRFFAQEPRVRYFRNSRNVGPSYNVLNGIQIAQGCYLSILMADDYYNHGYLAGLLPRLLGNPDVVVGYTAIRWVNEHGEMLTMPRHPGYQKQDYDGGRNEVAELLIHDNYIPPSAALIQREPFLKVWRRDPMLNGAGDWLSMLQVAEKHPDFIFLSEPGVSYRAHSAQLSTEFYSSSAPLADHIRLVEGVFERGAESKLQGRELEVAAHLRRRLALYPGEQNSSLGLRVGQLCKRLEDLAALYKQTLFSIVLTTYNRPLMLLDALRSLSRQSLQDFEVFLVNDHGTPVEQLLEDFEFPLTYIYKGTNEGLSAARNTALSLARGRYVCYLDDDDMYLPDHLATLAKAFEIHPEAVVYTGVEYAAEEIVEGERRVVERSEPFRHEQFDKERLFIQNYIPVNTWAHPRSAVAKVGEFDTGLSAFEDWDMLLRLALRYPFVHVNDVTAEVRTRQNDSGSDDHMLSREHQRFAELYKEMYSRYSDLGSERVRKGRAEQLRSLGVAPAGEPAPVRTWLSARTLTQPQQRLAAAYVEQHKSDSASLLVILLALDADESAIQRSLASLGCQIDAGNIAIQVFTSLPAPENFTGAWTCCDAANWVDELNALIGSLDADWVMLLTAGDELVSSGVQVLSLELLSRPDCHAICADALYRQPGDDLGVALRPDFNLDYLLSFPRGVSTNWLFRRAELLAIGGFANGKEEVLEYDAILRLINQHGVAGFGHVAEPLVLSDAPVLADSEAERAAILEHLTLRGYQKASVSAARPGQYRIDYGHDAQPLVSIIIILQDQFAAAQRCVMSILEQTSYPNYEVLLIDNASQQAETLSWLESIEAMGSAQLQVLRSQSPLSYSELCNQGALNSQGEYLLMLRPDAAAIEASWLGAMMNHALRPEVGMVGPRTIDAEGNISHAGLVLGLEGPAGRVFVGESAESAGYMQRLQVEQNPGALGDGCWLVRKSDFVELGGLDAGALDGQAALIDLCLRVTGSGQLLVWTPSATLLHNVETERLSVEIEDELYRRWLPRLARDPAYNANLSLVKKGGFKLTDPQISWRPLDIWRPQPVVLAHPADFTGCGQYRVMQPFNALQREGLIDGALSFGLMHVADFERYNSDAVILQRQISDERIGVMRRMKAFSRAFKVYELDDYLPNLPMKSVHRSHMPKDIVKSLRRGLSFVDRFVVSTEPLAEAFAGFHEDIRVVHNRLDPRWWRGLPVSQRGTSSKPRVGWAGGASHTGDLELIFDVVKDLAGEVEWVFFGMCPDKLRPYVHEFHPGVAIEQYPRKLAELNLDLALAPVEQNLFNECKSNLRLLEYGICGYPVICSDVRCYAGDLPVTRVKNRYRDWMEAIRTHLSDLEASAAQGKALQAAVEQRWMLEGEALSAWQQAWLP